jgi:preprotein translocase subunit SecB
MQQATPPSVEINIDVKAQTIGPENYEVVLTINASAKAQNDTLFLIELTYGAVVTIRNVPQQMMPQVVLVETPRLMFPFARNIISDTTRDGVFPPLMINPVDLAEPLRRNQPAGGPIRSRAPTRCDARPPLRGEREGVLRSASITRCAASSSSEAARRGCAARSCGKTAASHCRRRLRNRARLPAPQQLDIDLGQETAPISAPCLADREIVPVRHNASGWRARPRAVARDGERVNKGAG